MDTNSTITCNLINAPNSYNVMSITVEFRISDSFGFRIFLS